MHIISISWLSELAKEAEITVSSNNLILTVFSQPCSVSIGDIINDSLHVFSAKSIMLAENSELKIESEVSSLSAFITCTVDDLELGLCSVNSIKLQLDDYIPGGIESGDVIQFQCARLDLW